MKFPARVYVRIEKESNGGDEYFVASCEPDGEHGEQIGIYQLVSIKKLKIKESLV